MSPTSEKTIDFEDEFVNIFTGKASQNKEKAPKDFYESWLQKASASLSIPPIFGADALRALHPKHSLVMTQGWNLSIMAFPGAQATPLENMPLITNLVFEPLGRSYGVPGVLIDSVQFGGFHMLWQGKEFLLYQISYVQGFGTYTQYFILHEGPEEVTRLYLLAVGAWTASLHDEIWVFNQGYWNKDHALWVEVQKADWKDVILKDEFKEALQKDVYGFFASEAIYKELSIPWKRGLIMHGPPGNGKTISLKTIMKTCGAKGYAPLYVKSFQSYMGEEGSMAAVFGKARQLAPCVVILEDLDSLINDRNRSFFLNQLDGLEGNDGLLIIGTTNHFERLDPGLSTRPSRFDRKYKFDDPDQGERKLYAQYWQKKLASNKETNLSDQLVDDVAKLTERFSFAYLKEAFVSSLVTFAGMEGEKPPFEKVLKETIETLRKQLDKQFSEARASLPLSTFSPSAREDTPFNHYGSNPRRARAADHNERERDFRRILDTLSESASRPDPLSTRLYQNSSRTAESMSRLETRSKDVRALLDALSDSLASLDLPSHRVYDAVHPTRHYERGADLDNDGSNYRALLDRLASQNERLNSMIADTRLYASQSPRQGPGPRGDWVANPNAPTQFGANPLGTQFTGPRGGGAPFGSDLA